MDKVNRSSADPEFLFESHSAAFDPDKEKDTYAEDYYMNLSAGKFESLVNLSSTGGTQGDTGSEIHDNAYYMSLQTKYSFYSGPEHDADYYMRQDSPAIRKYREYQTETQRTGASSGEEKEREERTESADHSSGASGQQREESEKWSQGSGEKSSGKTSEDLSGDIRGYNRYLSGRQKSSIVKNRLTHAVKSGSGLLKAGLTDRDEESEAVEEAAENAGVVRFAGGEILDRMELSDIVDRNILTVNRQTAAGNVFRSEIFADRDIFKEGTFEGARIIDPEKVTPEDIDIFHYVVSHGKITEAEYERIKGKKRHLSGKKFRKRALELQFSSEINSFEEYVKIKAEEGPEFFTRTEREILSKEDALLIARNQSEFEENRKIIKKILLNRDLTGEFADVDLDSMSSEDIRDLVKRRKKFFLFRKKDGSEYLLDIEKDPLFAAGIKALYQNDRSLKASKRVLMRRAGRAGEMLNWGRGRVFRVLDRDADFSAMHSGISSEAAVFHTGTALAADTAKLGSMAVYGTGSLINAGVAGGLHLIGADGAAETVRGAGRAVNTGIDFTKKTVRNVVSFPGNAIGRIGQTVGTAAGHVFGSIAFRIQTAFVRARWFQAAAGSPAVKFIAGKAFQFHRVIKWGASTVFGIIRAPFRLLSKALGIGRKGMLVVCIAVGALILFQGAFVVLFSGTAAPSSVISLILSNEDQFKDYQKKYDVLDEAFTNQVTAVVNGFANKRDYSGAAIHFGINRPAQSLKGYSNSVEPYLKDYDLPEEFQNGVHLSYLYNGSNASGLSSNIKDCIAAMAVIMGQDQSSHHKEALDLLGALYESTHSYIAAETPLYYCGYGDRLLHYFCNEKAENYPSSPLMANAQVKKYEEPFDPEKNGSFCSVHKEMVPDDMKTYAGCQRVDSPEDYSDVETEEYEVISDSYETDEGEEIKYEYYEGHDDANPAIHTTGSTGKTLCFHNDGHGEKVADYDYVRERKSGDYQQAADRAALNKIFNAVKENDESSIQTYLNSDHWSISFPEWAGKCDNLGFYYYYDTVGNLDSEATNTGVRGLVVYCKGHDHYGCETGHDVPVCYGHVDLNMTIGINGIEKIFDLGGVPVSGDNSDVDGDLLSGAKRKDSAEVAETEAEDHEEDRVVRLTDSGEDNEDAD